MNMEILKHNAVILWNVKDENLTCDDQGKLETISKWNIFGRILKFLQNINGGVDKKISQAVINTLHEINENKKPIYVWDKDIKSAIIFFDDQEAYSDRYPVYCLARRENFLNRFKDLNAISDEISTLDKSDAKIYPFSKSAGKKVEDPHVLHFHDGDFDKLP